MFDSRSRVGLINDHIGFLKAFLDISLRNEPASQEIPFFMDLGCIRFQSPFGCQDGFELLILDFNVLESLLRLFYCLRHDQSNRVADKANPVLRQNRLIFGNRSDPISSRNILGRENPYNPALL